nr:DNA-damage-inducible SOS response protein [Klebsiella pneumoniae]
MAVAPASAQRHLLRDAATFSSIRSSNMLLNAADKALWRLALPMIFSNITVPLLGLVDTAVIGHWTARYTSAA